MAGIRHTFTSPKSDGIDNTLVRPSDWNNEHTIDSIVMGASTDRAVDIGTGGEAGNFPDASHVVIHRELTRDQTLEGGLIVCVSNAVAATAVPIHEKAAMIGLFFQSGISHIGTDETDGVGVIGQGWVMSPNPSGCVWGGLLEAIIQPGADGRIAALEVGIVNYGSVQTDFNSTSSKVGIGLATHQYDNPAINRGTAGILFSAEPDSWEYGIVMQQCHTTMIYMQNPSGDVGTCNGIDMKNHANWGTAIIIPNATPIRAYDVTGGFPRNVMFLTTGDVLTLGQDAIRTAIASPVNLPEVSANPAATAAGAELNFYMKGDKFVIQFNDGGTTKYFTLDMTQAAGGGAAAWVATTSAP